MLSQLLFALRPAAVLIALAGTAAALDLATFDIIDQGGGVGDMTGVRVTIHDQSPGPGVSPSYQLGDYLTITPADVGTTFTITAATDPDFIVFRDMITNGVDNNFGYSVDDLPTAGSMGIGWTEGNLFAPGTHSFGPGNFSSIGQIAGPDFAGYDITAFTLTINSFTLSSGGGFNSYDFRATATIVGAPVPEPSLGALLLSGGALLWWRSHMRRS
ncbi:MAG: hypothetical protein ACJ8I9_09480 [Chthoniobacterales bacterium]